MMKRGTLLLLACVVVVAACSSGETAETAAVSVASSTSATALTTTSATSAATQEPSTSVPPTTATTAAVEITTFIWGSGVAELGLLKQERICDSDAVCWNAVYVSGRFLEFFQKEIEDANGQLVDFWIAVVDFGTNPATSEPVRGEFLFGSDQSEFDHLLVVRNTARWLSFDPDQVPTAGGSEAVAFESPTEVISTLEPVTRYYPMLLMTFPDDGDAGFCEGVSLCEQLFTYNGAIVAAMKGEQRDLSADGFGMIWALYITAGVPEASASES